MVSFSTPVSNYQTNTGLGYIIAIGNRATKYTASGVAHLKTGFRHVCYGPGRLQPAHRPGAQRLLGEAKVGYAGPKTYLEGFASFQKSNDGTDISQQGFNGFFTATRVNYLRLGVSVFRPWPKASAWCWAPTPT